VRLVPEVADVSYQYIKEKLAQRETIILDGAIGTEILRREVTWADHQLMSRPEFVRTIHADYINAGAEVISTNSFQLCKRALFNHFRDDVHRKQVGASDLDTRANTLLAQSVKLAVEAREHTKAERPVAVAAAHSTHGPARHTSSLDRCWNRTPLAGPLRCPCYGTRASLHRRAR